MAVTKRRHDDDNTRSYKRPKVKVQSWREKKRIRQRKKNEEVIAELESRRKEQSEEAQAASDPLKHAVEPSTSQSTLSIALPGSIITNAQSFELRTLLAGQIARAAAVFCVDEVIVYDDTARLTDEQIEAYKRGEQVRTTDAANPNRGKTDPNVFLARILQYLETPQYLRKMLFPISVDFKFVGLLNPLDCPHHMRADDFRLPYREAVVLNKPCRDEGASFVDAGIVREVKIDKSLVPGVRVTLKASREELERKKPVATVVSASEPKQKLGVYWGYNVRIAKNLSIVLSECPYEGGYDLTMGTSDRGEPIGSIAAAPFREAKHMLLVLGGLAGIEAAVDADESIQTSSDKTHQLFDMYVNTCSPQGARTIRTEEALLISLSALRMKMQMPE